MEITYTDSFYLSHPYYIDTLQKTAINNIVRNTEELRPLQEQLDAAQAQIATKSNVCKYLSAGFMVVTAILAGFAIYTTVTEMLEYYKVAFIPIPQYIVEEADITQEVNGTKVVINNQTAYYKVVPCNRKEGSSNVEKENYKVLGTANDLNGDVGKQWLALYSVKYEYGNPILADSFKVVTGTTELPGGYETGIHRFGEVPAFNLTSKYYCYNDEPNGTYVYFRNDAETVAAMAMKANTGKTSDDEKAEENTEGSVFSLGYLAIGTGVGLLLGGGIMNYGTMTLNGCSVAGNSAKNAGGGMMLAEGSQTSFSDNNGIGENYAKNGGGIYIQKCRIEMKNTSFDKNVASDSGGALWIDRNMSAEFQKVNISSNSSTANGAGIYTRSELFLTDSTIKGNTGGSGVYFDSDHKLTLKNTSVTGNAGGIYMNAVRITDGEFTLTNGRIYHCQTIDSADNCNGGAIFLDKGTVRITDCTIEDCSSEDHGGAIYSDGGEIYLKKVTFSGNQCRDYGGAICLWDETLLEVRSCKFYDNRTEEDGGAVYVEDAPADHKAILFVKLYFPWQSCRQGRRCILYLR